MAKKKCEMLSTDFLVGEYLGVNQTVVCLLVVVSPVVAKPRVILPYIFKDSYSFNLLLVIDTHILEIRSLFQISS